MHVSPAIIMILLLLLYTFRAPLISEHVEYAYFLVTPNKQPRYSSMPRERWIPAVSLVYRGPSNYSMKIRVNCYRYCTFRFFFRALFFVILLCSVSARFWSTREKVMPRPSRTPSVLRGHGGKGLANWWHGMTSRRHPPTSGGGWRWCCCRQEHSCWKWDSSGGRGWLSETAVNTALTCWSTSFTKFIKSKI